MNYLSILKYILVLSIAIFFASCSKEDDAPQPKNELEQLQLAATLSNDRHTITFYTANGKFQTGYNAVFFQIKNADGSLVSNAVASWIPVMHMMSMTHSCPYSSITKKENAVNTYAGYLVFQMAGTDEEYWELTLNYTIDGTSYTATHKIAVEAAPKRTVESFMASDGNRYVIAMTEPTAPIVGINTMKAVVYKMETMMNFTPVANHTITIDPRMPGMGNHSSPNNVALTGVSEGNYEGKLSLTMTGYWKINLQFLNPSGEVLKGEEVTDTNEGSSIFFEVEF